MYKNIMKREMQPWFKGMRVVTKNYYLHPSTGPKDIQTCDCQSYPSRTSPSGQICTDDVCLNFATYVECTPGHCSANCGNMRITKSITTPAEVFDAGPKGWGLRLLQDAKPGQFIMEYVGEVINKTECERRKQRAIMSQNRHLYLMQLSSNEFIDSRKIGSSSRFFNHSCMPNCTSELWEVGGKKRVGIFVKKDLRVKQSNGRYERVDVLPAGTELTIDYDWKALPGRKRTRCFCGAGEGYCRGFLETWAGDGMDDVNAWMDEKTFVWRNLQSKDWDETKEERKKIHLNLTTPEKNKLIMEEQKKKDDDEEEEDLDEDPILSGGQKLVGRRIRKLNIVEYRYQVADVMGYDEEKNLWSIEYVKKQADKNEEIKDDGSDEMNGRFYIDSITGRLFYLHDFSVENDWEVMDEEQQPVTISKRERNLSLTPQPNKNQNGMKMQIERQQQISASKIQKKQIFSRAVQIKLIDMLYLMDKTALTIKFNNLFDYDSKQNVTINKYQTFGNFEKDLLDTFGLELKIVNTIFDESGRRANLEGFDKEEDGYLKLILSGDSEKLDEGEQYLINIVESIRQEWESERTLERIQSLKQTRSLCIGFDWSLYSVYKTDHTKKKVLKFPQQSVLIKSNIMTELANDRLFQWVSNQLKELSKENGSTIFPDIITLNASILLQRYLVYVSSYNILVTSQQQQNKESSSMKLSKKSITAQPFVFLLTTILMAGKSLPQFKTKLLSDLITSLYSFHWKREVEENSQELKRYERMVNDLENEMVESYHYDLNITSPWLLLKLFTKRLNNEQQMDTPPEFQEILSKLIISSIDSICWVYFDTQTVSFCIILFACILYSLRTNVTKLHDRHTRYSLPSFININSRTLEVLRIDIDDYKLVLNEFLAYHQTLNLTICNILQEFDQNIRISDQLNIRLYYGIVSNWEDLMFKTKVRNNSILASPAFYPDTPTQIKRLSPYPHHSIKYQANNSDLTISNQIETTNIIFIKELSNEFYLCGISVDDLERGGLDHLANILQDPISINGLKDSQHLYYHFILRLVPEKRMRKKEILVDKERGKQGVSTKIMHELRTFQELHDKGLDNQGLPGIINPLAFIKGVEDVEVKIEVKKKTKSNDRNEMKSKKHGEKRKRKHKYHKKHKKHSHNKNKKPRLETILEGEEEDKSDSDVGNDSYSLFGSQKKNNNTKSDFKLPSFSDPVGLDAHFNELNEEKKEEDDLMINEKLQSELSEDVIKELKTNSFILLHPSTLCTDVGLIAKLGKTQPLPFKFTIFLLRDLLTTLSYIHEVCGFSVRNFDPSSLVIDRQGRLTISKLNMAVFSLYNDFHSILSSSLNQNIPQPMKKDQDRLGKQLFFMSPEEILGKKPGIISDTWGFINIAATLFFGKPLFTSEKPSQQLEYIFRTCGTPTSAIKDQSLNEENKTRSEYEPKEIWENMKSLPFYRKLWPKQKYKVRRKKTLIGKIEKLPLGEYLARYSTENDPPQSWNVLQNIICDKHLPWATAIVVDFLSLGLTVNPNNRPTINQLLNHPIFSLVNTRDDILERVDIWPTIKETLKRERKIVFDSMDR